MMAFSCFALTIAIYYGTKQLYRRTRKIYFFSPLVLTPAVVIFFILLTFRIPYESYNAGAKWLTGMIGPATVALAVPLYKKNLHVLKKYAAEILISVLTGTVIAIVSSAAIAKLLHLNIQITESLLPHSATTPIAVAVSQMIGGVPAISALFVLMTGLLGIIMGPLIIRVFRFKHDISKGILLGTSAHAAGTSKAFEFGSVSGTISSISMILAAFLTLCIVPWFIKLF